jgi:hypothetical protein
MSVRYVYLPLCTEYMHLLYMQIQRNIAQKEHLYFLTNFINVSKFSSTNKHQNFMSEVSFQLYWYQNHIIFWQGSIVVRFCEYITYSSACCQQVS